MTSKFWNMKTQKLLVSIGMGLTGYHILAQSFSALPALPTIATNELLMGISPLTIAAGLSIYGIFLLSKF